MFRTSQQRKKNKLLYLWANAKKNTIVKYIITATQTENMTLRNLGVWWPGGLEHWTGNRVVLGSNPTAATSFQNFGNSVYPALTSVFRGNTKSCRSILVSIPGEVKDPTLGLRERQL